MNATQGHPLNEYTDELTRRLDTLKARYRAATDRGDQAEISKVLAEFDSVKGEVQFVTLVDTKDI